MARSTCGPVRLELTLAADLPMTPLVDVVFQLLVFFVLTVRPTDVLAHLEANRPRGGGGTPIPMIRIEVKSSGYAMMGEPVTVNALEERLRRLAGIDERQAVLVVCDGDSEHETLIRALDLCAKTGLANLSVLTAR